MKLQLASIVLCALVSSSFGHDIFCRSRHAHKVKKAHHHNRQNSNTCLCPCEYTSTTGGPVSPSSDPTSPSSSSTFSTETARDTPSDTSSSIPSLSTSSSTESLSISSNDPSGSTNSSQTNTFLFTAQSPPTTESPPPNNNSALQIYVNASIDVVAVVNVTANIAFALDVNNHLTALFNGSSGIVIIFSYQERIGYYISGNSSVSWNVSQENFQSFFAKIDLTVVYKYAESKGTRFTVRSIRVEISWEITHIMQALGISVSNYTTAAALWIQISVRWSLILEDILKGFLTVIGNGVTEFRGSIWRIVIIFQGLAEFIRGIQGGVAVLIQKRVHFELSLIVNARTSIQVFIYIVTTLRRSNVDMRGLIADKSTNIFDLITVISGNYTVNTCGVITLIGRFVALAESRVQIGVFIQTLFDFYRRNNNSQVSIEGVRRCLISLRNAVRAWGWVQVVEQIDLLLSKKYVVNGVNIYTLIVILIQQSPNPLQNIAQIVVVFQKAVDIDTSVGELFLALVYVLRDDNGRVLISILLRTEINVSGNNGNLLSYVLSGVSVSELNAAINRGDLFYEFLKRLEIFGQIISAVDAGLGSCSNLSVRGIFTNSQFGIYRIRIAAIFLAVKGTIPFNSRVTPGPQTVLPPRILTANIKRFDVHHERAGVQSKRQHFQDKYGHHEDKHLLHREQGHGHLHGHHEEKHVLHHLKHLEHDKHHPHARNQENEKLSAMRGGH